MNIKNLTPHTLSFINSNCVYFEPTSKHYILNENNDSGETIIIHQIEPSNIIVRVKMVEQQIEEIDGIKVYQNTYTETEGLPPTEEGTIYIVSLLVAKANPNRTDLYMPNQMVYNSKGHIVGCLSLSKV